MSECCYYCRQYRRIEIEGQMVDEKTAGACRLRGILIGLGRRKHLSPMAFGCMYWRGKNKK